MDFVIFTYFCQIWQIYYLRLIKVDATDLKYEI